MRTMLQKRFDFYLRYYDSDAFLVSRKSDVTLRKIVFKLKNERRHFESCSAAWPLKRDVVRSYIKKNTKRNSGVKLFLYVATKAATKLQVLCALYFLLVRPGY